MKATVFFVNDPQCLYLNGEALGAYEVGSITHVKDYSKSSNKIIASIPTSRLLYIQYFDVPNVIVTIKDVKKEVADLRESPQ